MQKSQKIVCKGKVVAFTKVQRYRESIVDKNLPVEQAPKIFISNQPEKRN